LSHNNETANDQENRAQQIEVNSAGQPIAEVASNDNARKVDSELAKQVKQTHDQVLEQRYVFLKNAFTNPHEKFLEYEPWQHAEEHYRVADTNSNAEDGSNNRAASSDHDKNSGKSSSGQGSQIKTKRMDLQSPLKFRDGRTNEDVISSDHEVHQPVRKDALPPGNVQMNMEMAVGSSSEQEKIEQDRIDNITEKQKKIQDQLENDVNLTIIAEEAAPADMFPGDGQLVDRYK